MAISLSEHFTYKKLLGFTIPSIVMMIFTSIYGVIDGIFVSNFVGKTPFAALNLIMPFLMIFGTLGFMIGTGGSALVSKTMGTGRSQEAKGIFSMLIYISIAFGIVLSVIGILLIRVFIGYAIGAAPMVGYHFGAGNHGELKNLFRKSLIIILTASTIMTILAESLAHPLSSIFVRYDPVLFEMTKRAFMLYSLSFLFAGFSIFGSSFFTALNDGLVSASISFIRTLVFQTSAVMILPIFLKLDGIWLAIVAAEFMALVVTVYCFVKFKDKYHYV